MKIVYLLVILTFIMRINTATAQNGTFDLSTDQSYKLIWVDTFSTFDANRWKKANDFNHYGEPQVYLSSQVNVSNNKAILLWKKAVN